MVFSTIQHLNVQMAKKFQLELAINHGVYMMKLSMVNLITANEGDNLCQKQAL